MQNQTVIYLDHAAATPVNEAVMLAMEPFFSAQFHNPSALYLDARKSREALESARAQVAFWLGARPSEVIFTAGATEANNLAIQGIMQRWPEARVLASSIEHESVLAPVTSHAKHALIPVDERGLVDEAALQKAIDDETVLVSIILANNEIGTLQPLTDIAALMAEVRESRKLRGVALPLFLHTDASQAANYLDIHVNQLGVDLLTLNAAKTYGPKQSGALYVSSQVKPLPIIQGGGQEFGFRSGTENVAGAVGLATALTIAQNMRKDEFVRLHELRRYFIEQLMALRSDVMVHGHRKHCQANIISFSVPNLDAERAVMMLDEAGVQCGTGAACSASKHTPSHVILALGLDESVANSTLRISMGRSTTKDMLDDALAALGQVFASEHVWMAVDL